VNAGAGKEWQACHRAIMSIGQFDGRSNCAKEKAALLSALSQPAGSV
jgi:hypothetical protein